MAFRRHRRYPPAGAPEPGADFYASLRTQAALEKAEVAVVLLDSSEPLTEQDTRVIQLVVDSGRALVLAYNKWDLMDDERRKFLEREREVDLVQVQWAPRINLAAKTSWHVNRLPKALDTALESWQTRVPTGRLNACWRRSCSRTRTRCAVASSHASCSAPRWPPNRRGSCCSPPVHGRRLPPVHRAPAA